MIIADRLRALTLFESLNEAQITAMADCASEAVIPAGDALFSEGSEASHFFLILRGAVALQSASPTQSPATFLTLGRNDFVGLSWLAPPYRWAFDARATSNVDAIAIDADAMREKCDDDPVLGYALMKIFVPALIERLKSARLQTLDLYKAPA